MPYPIENHLYLRGSRDELASFLAFCGDGFDLGKFIACPDAAEDRGWCLEHWGTPCNAFRVELPEPPGAGDDSATTEILVRFETALGPPLPVVTEASRRFPELDFDLRYIGDEFPGNGIYECRAGEVVSAADIPLMQALGMVMEYLWDDELRNFQADPQPGHIFEDLVTLDRWLNRHQRTAPDYLGDEEEEGRGEGLEASGFAFRGSKRPPGEPKRRPRQLSKVVDDVIGNCSTPHAPRCGRSRTISAASAEMTATYPVYKSHTKQGDLRRNPR